MEKKYLKNFSNWASSVKFENIPDDVVRKAKLQIANNIAAGLGSLNSDGKEYTKEFGIRGEGNCTVIDGRETDLVSAYFLNSSYSMMHDFDDYLFMGHTGHSSVFSSLALCEKTEKSSEEFIKNVIIGNELGGRLGASVIIGPHNGQMWSFIHQAITAAITGVALGGDGETVLDSVSMSLYNPPYTLEPGFMGGESKFLTASASGSTGLNAGFFSLSGASGNGSIFETEKGFLDKFSFLPLPETLTGFGESWVTRSIAFKPYPGCAYIQSPLECVNEIITDPEEIEEIEVRGSLLTIGMENMSKPYRDKSSLLPVNVNFSVPYSVALMLLNGGDLETSHLTNSNLQDNLDELNEIVEKIDLVHDWEYTVEALKGVRKGLDFVTILKEKGAGKILSAIREMSGEHSNISGWKEFAKLLGSGKIFSLLNGTTEQESWEDFDLENASFENLEFNFGSSVKIHTKNGKTKTRKKYTHQGTSQKEPEEIKKTVKEKLEKEASQNLGEEKSQEIFNIIMDLENKPLTELTSIFTN